MKKLLIILLGIVFLTAGCESNLDTIASEDTSVKKITAESTPGNQTGGSADINQTVEKGSEKMLHETGHFKIYYLEQDKDCLEDLSNGLEAAYAKVTKDLDCELDYKVDVMVYPDIGELQAAIGYTAGTGQDDYITAATIGRRISITSPLNPGPARDYAHMVNSSTFHEFTHVVINEITSSDSWPTEVPRWLNEGIASYEGGPPMPEEILRMQVSQRVLSEQAPTFEEMAGYGQDFILKGGYFFTLPAGEFLVKKYGFDKVKKLILSPEDYKGIFGKSEQDLWKEWIEYLKENYT